MNNKQKIKEVENKLDGIRNLDPLKVSEKLWDERVERMEKLCRVKAPVWIIISEALLLCKSIGMTRALRYHFYLSYWTRWSSFWWLVWHKKILRKPTEEIDKLLDEAMNKMVK